MSSTLPLFTAVSRSGTGSRDRGATGGFDARPVHCVALAEATSARSISAVSATTVGGRVGASGRARVVLATLSRASLHDRGPLGTRSGFG
jgi:hypothetical protein